PSSPVEGRRAAAAEPIAIPSISAATTEPAAMLALPNVRERIRIQTSSTARLHAPARAATRELVIGLPSYQKMKRRAPDFSTGARRLHRVNDQSYFLVLAPPPKTLA